MLKNKTKQKKPFPKWLGKRRKEGRKEGREEGRKGEREGRREGDP